MAALACARARSTWPCPQRGPKRALQETVTRTAAEDLARHRLRRASDHNARPEGPRPSCRARWACREAPLRIECYDMSHLQGTDYVGSMVVMEDGLAKRVGLPPVQGQDGGRQRRLRGHGRGADPAAHRPASSGQGRAPGRRSPPAAGSPTAPTCSWSTAARASWAWPSGCSRAGARGRDPAGLPGQAVRGGLPPRSARARSGSGAARRPSTCSSGSATRPTASPSPTTASGGASA